MKLFDRRHTKLLTYADYLSWDDDFRWELINGVAYNITPAPGRIHQDISMKLSACIYLFLKNKKCEVYSAPFDVRLTDSIDDPDDKIFNVVQPDIVVVCDRAKLDDRGCKGAPDVIVEILSPSTAARDMKEKFILYEKYKVKEYWLVHPVDKYILVYRLDKNDTFLRDNVYAGEDVLKSSVLKGFKMDMVEIFVQ